jgi:hypothetical protein
MRHVIDELEGADEAEFDSKKFYHSKCIGIEFISNPEVENKNEENKAEENKISGGRIDSFIPIINNNSNFSKKS